MKETPWRPRGWLGWGVGTVVLAATYTWLGTWGLGVAMVGTWVTLVWAPSGLAVAVAILWGRQALPGILLGAFCTNLLMSGSWPLAMSIAFGNVGEAWFAAWWLRPRIDTALSNLRDLRDLVVFGGFLAPVVSASCGVLSLWVKGDTGGEEAWEAWLTWWMGDAGGILALTPFLLAWGTPPRERVGVRSSRVEWLLLVVVCTGVSGLGFFRAFDPSLLHTEHLVFPCLAWGALRYGPRGSMTTSLLFCVLAVVGTIRGGGPFADADVQVALVSLWGYLTVVTTTSLVFTALVAERDQALGAVAHERRRLEDALEAADDAAFEVDLTTGKVRCDLRWAMRFGDPLERVPTELSAWRARVHPDDRGIARGALVRHLSGETPTFEFKLRLVTSGGASRWVQARGRVVERDGEGRATRVMGTLQDIEASERAERERAAQDARVRQRQRLESLGVLAGGVAHDFNNLLQAIRGHAELARADSGEDGRASLEVVVDAAERASGLCRQLQAYAGQGGGVERPVDVNAELKALGPLIRVSVSKSVEVESRLAEGVPAVLGDRHQLAQAALNLVTNASEALGEASGRIVLETSCARLEEGGGEGFVAPGPSPGRYVVLAVEDTGPGIAAEAQARMFEPFFTTKFPGRGLGLAAVYGIVQAHKGGVRIRSEGGAGARLELWFPVAEGVEVEGASAEGGVGSGGGAALVLDDEGAVRRFLARVLAEEEGYEVVEADDGPVALEEFAKDPARFRLAVLDMTLPRASGVEVLEALRARRPDLPVVLISGYAEHQARGEGERAQRVEFLQKPFAVEALRAALQRAREEMAEGS